jgi:hypothetical protein
MTGRLSLDLEELKLDIEDAFASGCSIDSILQLVNDELQARQLSTIKSNRLKRRLV